MVHMSTDIYHMNEAQLREFISESRSKDPNSLEGRVRKTALEDAEKLLMGMASKRKSDESEDITLDEVSS
jgi:hypothetical protein